MSFLFGDLLPNLIERLPFYFKLNFYLISLNSNIVLLLEGILKNCTIEGFETLQQIRFSFRGIKIESFPRARESYQAFIYGIMESFGFP